MSAIAQTEFACEVREVFSGDDLIVMVDLGVMNLFQRQRIRLAGVDTPNAIGSREDTSGGEVRRQVRQLARGRKAKLSVVTRYANSWVVQLTIETPEGPVDLNQRLVDQGYTYNAKKVP
jgi:endonuclease YncB( thermonuclease family)